jgi:adenylylsulfate kinase
MIDTNTRSIIKATTWKMIGFIIIFIVSFLVTSSYQKTLFVTIAYHTIMFLLYFAHEKIWNKIKWGKTTGIFIQMTGLSGAGKTTLANIVSERLIKKGISVEVIDGDEYRSGICSDLGFSAEDREENIKRLSFVGKVLGRNNVVCIMSAINPYDSTRKKVKNTNPNSKLVYVRCDLQEVILRDVKGLYKKALLPPGHADHIANFTGITDKFDEPLDSDLIIDTKEYTIEESAIKLEKFILQQIT